MLLEELWIDHLANAARIEPQTSRSLWLALCAQLDVRLGQGYHIYWGERIGYWSLLPKTEYIAQLSSGTSYIMPPRLDLSWALSPANSCGDLINISDLKDAISQATGIRLEAVVAWLSAIEPRLLASLEAGRDVSWANLGVFTPIVESGLVGFVFTPTASLWASLNRPFGVFSPVEVQNEAIGAHLERQSIEALSDLLAPQPIEIRYHQTADEASIPNDIAQGQRTEEEETMPAEVGDISLDTDSPASQAEPIVSTTEEIEPTLVASETTAEPSANIAVESEEHLTSRHTHKWLLGLLTIPILALCLWLWYSRSNHNTSTIVSEDTPLEHPIASDSSWSKPMDTVVIAPTDTVPTEVTPRTSTETTTNEVSDNKPNIKVEPSANSTETIVLQPGESLMQIALRKYGNKVFWVYIYEENRGKIANPNNIPLGLELHLPPARKYGIDASNTNSLDRALDLQRALLRQYK